MLAPGDEALALPPAEVFQVVVVFDAVIVISSVVVDQLQLRLRAPHATDCSSSNGMPDGEAILIKYSPDRWTDEEWKQEEAIIAAYWHVIVGI